MKKLIIISCIIFSYHYSQGQILDSCGLVGGNTSLTFSTTNTGKDGPKTSSFSLSPAIGLFFAKNLAVGCGMDYRHSAVKGSGISESSSSSFLVGPFIRKYFGDNNGKFYLQFDLGFGSVGSTSQNDVGLPMPFEYTEKSSVVAYDLGAGIAFFLHERVSMDWGVFYGWGSTKARSDDIKVKYSGFVFDVGFNIYFKTHAHAR